MPLVLAHILQILAQLPVLLRHHLGELLLVALLPGQFIAADLEGALKVPCLLTHLDHLVREDVLMGVGDFALLKLILLGLARLLQLGDLPHVAVLHEDQTFVLFSGLQQVVLDASQLSLEL